ncbi:transposase, partial [Actinomadura keratinilytica]|uniref:transposase n=1 Tax=Actinomadura keratinilytica TaxID=547461 RepID=UPI003CD08DAC
MVRRHELTDAEWAMLEPLLPKQRMGRPRADDRRVLNGIVFRFRSGVAWRDVPERYGSPNATGPGGRCTSASAGGQPTAPSPGCCRPPRRGRMR